jgi:Zn-dependent protease
MTTRTNIVLVICLIVAVILHEISHGLVAYWFGDDTAKRAGRLTLNPLPHIDPFGSIILPAIGVMSGGLLIGWAKPVPVNSAQLRNPRRDMLIVSLAGPATNFMLCAIAAVIARETIANYVASATGTGLLTLANAPYSVLIPFCFALANLMLGIFNLLPIPPLDGSAIIERALPARYLRRWYKYRMWGIVVIFGLAVVWRLTGTSPIEPIIDPFVNGLYSFVRG